MIKEKILELSEKGMRNFQIADELNISRNIVSGVLNRWRNRHNVKPKVWNPWTDEQKEIIRIGYMNGTHVNNIAVAVGRSESSVQGFANRNGFKFCRRVPIKDVNIEPIKLIESSKKHGMLFCDAVFGNKCLWINEHDRCCGKDRIVDSRYCVDHKKQSVEITPVKDAYWWLRFLRGCK